MSDSVGENVAQYTLSYYTKDDPDPQGPPYKYRTYYLDDVLAEAWRHHYSGGRPIEITQGPQIIFNHEDLLGALARISEFDRAQPGRPSREVAEMVARETAKSAPRGDEK
ncbi:MAG TPA: hypothetical protein VD966_06800 [Pyrinomonadaceae bacterium]|nr:hypothetical protein [Pyrinomonadaceae bacterium]